MSIGYLGSDSLFLIRVTRKLSRNNESFCLSVFTSFSPLEGCEDRVNDSGVDCGALLAPMFFLLLAAVYSSFLHSFTQPRSVMPFANFFSYGI